MLFSEIALPSDATPVDSSLWIGNDSLWLRAGEMLGSRHLVVIANSRPPRGPRSLPIGPALLALAASVLTLLAAEVLLRAAWHNPYRGERDHVLILPKIFPGMVRSYSRQLVDPDHASVSLRTGPRSYVLPSFQYADPQVTIAFLGGSTTECAAVKEELRFPALVADLLGERSIRANTLNGSRSGNNVHDSLNFLLNHLVDDRPDFALMMHATNDVGRLTHDGSYAASMGAPLGPSHLQRWLKHALSRSSYLVAFARERLSAYDFRPEPLAPGVAARDTPERADRLPIDLYRQRLHAFVGLARAFGIRPVLVTQPLSSHVTSLTPRWHDLGAQARLNEVARQVGAAEQVTVIDLVRHLETEVPGWNEPQELFYDGMHVNDRGSRVYAEYIARRLYPLVRRFVARAERGDAPRPPGRAATD